MSHRIALTTAVDLLAAAYVGPSALPPLAVAKSPRYAQSYLLRDGTLVIPGINEAADRLVVQNQWHRYGKVHGWATYNQTISGTIWLSSFAQYAFEIARVFWPHIPKVIVGHSLGAGCAQILAQHWQCPAVCLATPAVASRRGPQLPGREDVLSILTAGDWLPALLPDGPVVRRFGPAHRVPVPSGHPEAHAITAYRAAIHAAAGRTLPTHWPA